MRLAMLLMLLASPALAGVSCPENEIAHGCYHDAVAYQSSTPTCKLSEQGLVPWSAGSTCEFGCYDLPAGALAARGVSNTVGGCGSNVRVSDFYKVVGPVGPPLAFEGVLFVHATLSPYTSAGAKIESGLQSASCNATPDGEAAISLSHAPGESFLLTAELGAGGLDGAYPAGEAVANATIRFRGLPEGYSVVSCQNYDLPTPAHPSSWGGVKALYR